MEGRFPMGVELIGNSPPMSNIRELIKTVADTALSVIIYGETGVGKEVIARELHRRSTRRDKRFVKVNCAALPSELLESELFGYERGAFTGATRFKPGKFEIASDGVIFLDEVGDIPLRLQAKLLQVLQGGEFSRLGGKDVKVNSWVISATNHDLAEDMREGSFREDLYYRLNIIKIDVPPLRERREDLLPLIDYFVNRYRSEFDISEQFPIGPEMRDLFLHYEWPGNVRELANTIQRVMVMGDWDEVRHQMSAGTTSLMSALRDQGLERAPDSREPIPLKQLKAEAGDYIEKRVIAHVLNMTGGNKAKAARALNISYKALFYKMRNLGLR
jgi:transcriptional regulator with GAF, ATPase, and Fis domain